MAKETTYEEIARELKNRIYKPVYYLMGEESYYIDRISEYIAQTVLNENEKEFNQTIVYGADTDIATVINAAKRYPMMSKYQVVIVKEAQNIKNIEELVYYLQKPLDSTILVLCHKHGTLDRRKKLAAEIEKVGVLFESKKIKDAQLPGFISSYLKRRSVEIEPKASEMMAEFVGADLSRMAGELEKLIITLPRGQKRITPEQIERNIGISKDYNNFGLSTLHQLRGRVGRSDIQSYCLLVTKVACERLNFLENTNDGFVISEYDFEHRGEGDLFGIRQSGEMNFKLADIHKDYKILVQAKEDACDYLNRLSSDEIDALELEWKVRDLN